MRLRSRNLPQCTSEDFITLEAQLRKANIVSPGFRWMRKILVNHLLSHLRPISRSSLSMCGDSKKCVTHGWITISQACTLIGRAIQVEKTSLQRLQIILSAACERYVKSTLLEAVVSMRAPTCPIWSHCHQRSFSENASGVTRFHTA